jgi:hypothetical protein
MLKTVFTCSLLLLAVAYAAQDTLDEEDVSLGFRPTMYNLKICWEAAKQYYFGPMIVFDHCIRNWTLEGLFGCVNDALSQLITIVLQTLACLTRP